MWDALQWLAHLPFLTCSEQQPRFQGFVQTTPPYPYKKALSTLKEERSIPQREIRQLCGGKVNGYDNFFIVHAHVLQSISIWMETAIRVLWKSQATGFWNIRCFGSSLLCSSVVDSRECVLNVWGWAEHTCSILINPLIGLGGSCDWHLVLHLQTMPPQILSDPLIH